MEPPDDDVTEWELDPYGGVSPGPGDLCPSDIWDKPMPEVDGYVAPPQKILDLRGVLTSAPAVAIKGSIPCQSTFTVENTRGLPEMEMEDPSVLWDYLDD
jgi:hypothetical protein